MIISICKRLKYRTVDDTLRKNRCLAVDENDIFVLIVDDVTRSGASLEACREILLQSGAKRVAMLALGQSV